jgi:hypothetical protein
MSDIKLNDDHDVDVSGMALHLVEDEPGNPVAIAQEIGIALMLFQGEWFLDTPRGFPWYQRVFVKNPSEQSLIVLFSKYIRSVAGVLEVPALALDIDAGTRHMDMSYTARAQDGGIIEDRLPVILPPG